LAGWLSLVVLILETGRVSERLRVREIDDDEGRRLVRIIRRGSGSVVTWRRAQMVLLSAQGMDAAAIAKVAFTSEDRVRDVIHNFNADGFSSLYPTYRGGRPPKFSLGQRREIKKIAKSRPAEHDLPFSTWSLSKLAEFLVAEGVVDDISHEGLRTLLGEEGVSFPRLKTWKTSTDPDYAAKKARVEHLYAIADGEVIPDGGRTGRGLLRGSMPIVELCGGACGVRRTLLAGWASGGGRGGGARHNYRLSRKASSGSAGR
jgi:transposase